MFVTPKNKYWLNLKTPTLIINLFTNTNKYTSWGKYGGNGVKLPPFIQNPIEKANLDSNGLIWWNEVQVDITNALRSKVRHEDHLEEDKEMKTEDVAVEETQLEQSSLEISHVWTIWYS